MQNNLSIKLKSALVMIVFSANTVIGFACAMGVDLDFTSVHPQHQEEAQSTIYNIASYGNNH